MIRKIKETLLCIGDGKSSHKGLDSNRKKRVHWKNENNNRDICNSKRTHGKSQNAFSKELDRCITLMSLKFNYLYIDEFIEDIEDIELLWADACARRRNVPEKRRAGTQSDEVVQAKKMKSRAP